MDEITLKYILSELYKIRDGILEDSSRTIAAYHLGILLCYVDLKLQDIEEKKDFGHT